MEKVLMDIIDANDRVVGTATLDEIYEKKLTHRIVHVLLFNKKGEMAVQLRARTEDYKPLHWGTAVGGHVHSGESYLEAAKRELWEEIGSTINVDLSLAYKDMYEVPDLPGFHKLLAIFTAFYDGPFDLDPSEVEEMHYFSIERLEQMMKEKERFLPELTFILKTHYFPIKKQA